MSKYILTQVVDGLGDDSKGIKLITNSELKTDKPSISKDMVEEFIKDYEVITAQNKITIVIATLKNGFNIVESSACVSPENYDKELGAKICKERIKDKVWGYLGFLLQTAIKEK